MIRRLALTVGAALLLGVTTIAPVDDRLILGSSMPNRLSEFNLLIGPNGGMPNRGVVPYTLHTPLFSDYAEKWRFAYLPTGKAPVPRGQGMLDFPIGTVLIKSFGYPADMRAPNKDIRILETRLLIRRASGWIALPYVWNADGSDATLRRAGTRLPVKWTHTDGSVREISYAVPNANQCKGCHDVAGQLTPIGPKPRNIASGLPIPARTVAIPRWDDPKASLNLRARAYLEVNCAHCHNPKGPANTSGLWLHWEQPQNVNLGLGKRPTAAGRGSGDRAFAIAPRHPEASYLPFRMQSLDPGIAMPELGRATVHEEGVKLVEDWIRTLEPETGK